MHVIYCTDYNLTWLEDVRHPRFVCYRFVWEAQEKINAFESYCPPAFSRHSLSLGDLSQPWLLPPPRQCWLSRCWFILDKKKSSPPLPRPDLSPVFLILVNGTVIYTVMPGNHHSHIMQILSSKSCFNTPPLCFPKSLSSGLYSFSESCGYDLLDSVFPKLVGKPGVLVNHLDCQAPS